MGWNPWKPLDRAGQDAIDWGTMNPSQQYDRLAGRSNYDPETAQEYTGPGSEYGRPTSGGWQWNPGAGTKFANENQIDPNTGMFRPGEGGLVPHNVALQMQAQSDQGIWRYKQAMMRSGMNYAKGALGLLQSFRPGGGATLEAGIYNQLGMMEFQRAAQTDYLDLLGDYRRKREDDARRAAKKAADRAMYTQIATAVIGAGAMIATGGAAAPVVMGMGAIGAAAANRQGAAAGQSAAASGTPQAMQASTGPVPNMATIQNQGGGGAMQAGLSGPVPGAAPQNAPSSWDIELANRLGQPYATQPTVGSKQNVQNVSIGGDAGVSAGSAQVGSSSGGAGGGMKQVASGGQAAINPIPLVGADGNFSPTAYAAHSARSYSDLPMQALTATSAANMMDDDVVFETLTFAVNRRWAERLAPVQTQFSGVSN
jgi:hypothetical protein